MPSLSFSIKQYLAPLFYATFVGFLFGFMFGPSNFDYALNYPRDLLAGLDPYRHPVGPNYVPYPLPIIFVGFPICWLPDKIGTGIFLSASIFLLYYFLARTNQPWRLLMLLSGPFFYCLLYCQWSIICTSLYFTSSLLPLILIKPQNALPLALLNKPKPWHLVLTVVLGAISLCIYPDWPFVFLSQISDYTGKFPPVTVLPAGPLVILALLKYREKRAWLLFLTSLTPQRMVYDQLALLLVAE